MRYSGTEVGQEGVCVSGCVGVAGGGGGMCVR